LGHQQLIFQLLFYLRSFQELEINSLTGQWLYNFLTYHEDMLTSSVKDLVKRKYNDCNILVANEYQFYDGPVYFVKMEDANIYRTVIIAYSKMQVTEEYRQQ